MSELLSRKVTKSDDSTRNGGHVEPNFLCRESNK